MSFSRPRVSPSDPAPFGLARVVPGRSPLEFLFFFFCLFGRVYSSETESVRARSTHSYDAIEKCAFPMPPIIPSLRLGRKRGRRLREHELRVAQSPAQPRARFSSGHSPSSPFQLTDPRVLSLSLSSLWTETSLPSTQSARTRWASSSRNGP